MRERGTWTNRRGGQRSHREERTSMRTHASLTLLTLALLATPAAAQQAPASQPATVASTPTACAPPTAATLFAAAPAAARARYFVDMPEHDDESDEVHDYLATTPRLVEVELDGIAPREAILGLEAIATEEDSSAVVLVFACRSAAWTMVGSTELEIDSGWNGTYDTRPGFAVMRAETIAGIGHDFLRVEVLDVRGSYDPRFVRRRFVLLHLVGGALVTALDLVVRESSEAGPERDEVYSATRTIILRAGRATRPPAYTLRVSTWEPDRTRGCRTTLVYDGRTFVPRDAACAAR